MTNTAPEHTEMPNQPSTRRTALDYAAAGWRVLPVRGKAPLISNYASRATIRDRTILLWYSDWPDAGVAILTGHRSGLVVLDVDPKNDGNSQGIPDTYTVRTPSGGSHHYFAYRGMLKSRVLRPGVDFRAEKAYVVAPPSPGYEIVGGDVVALPDDLLSSIAAQGVENEPKNPPLRGYGSSLTAKTITVDDPQSYANSALYFAVNDVRNANPGERNATLYRKTLKLAGLLEYLAEHDIRRHLAKAALDAGLHYDEVAHTIDSAIKVGRHKPITLQTFKISNSPDGTATSGGHSES